MNRIARQSLSVGVAVVTAACAASVLGQPAPSRVRAQAGALAQGTLEGTAAFVADEGFPGPFDVVWDGGGADNRWETPENWGTDAAPTRFDNVVFDGTSSKDCVVTGEVEIFDFTMTAGYGGTLDVATSSHDFTVHGHLGVEGGTIHWGLTSDSERYFRGDFIRTGGVMDASLANLVFDGAGQQEIAFGSGVVSVGRLIVDFSSIARVSGYVSARIVANLYGVTDLDGTIAFEEGAAQLSIQGVLNVLSGGVVDARAVSDYLNQGIVNELGSGVVLRNATGIGLTDPTGTIPVPQIDLGQPIYVMFLDDDENTNGTVPDTTLVSLTNMQNGDVEWLTLTETDNYTGVFRDAAGLPTSQAPPVSDNGVLEAALGNVVMLRYQDSEDPADIAVAFRVVYVLDCNGNGIDDLEDIANGTSEDCDQNGMPDECQLPPIGDGPDCNEDGIPDVCQLEGNDANQNGIPDDCEGEPGDADGDGVPDESDWCPDSDLQATIVIDGCDSGVANLLIDDGCTMLDLIMQCAADAGNHGQFVSCVAHLTNGWKKAGLITGEEKSRIQVCAAHADLP